MLSREAAIDALENKPNQNTHRLFETSAYIYDKDGNIFDRWEYLFQDWISEGIGRYDGE